MEWIAIIVLFVLVIALWVQTTGVRNWATTTSKWLQKHYDHHVEYFDNLGDPHPHEDWRAGPVGGEGDPPPFP